MLVLDKMVETSDYFNAPSFYDQVRLLHSVLKQNKKQQQQQQQQQQKTEWKFFP